MTTRFPLVPSVVMVLAGFLMGYGLGGGPADAAASPDSRSDTLTTGKAPATSRETMGQTPSAQTMEEERRSRALTDLFTALRGPETRRNTRLLEQALQQLQAEDIPRALELAMKQHGDEMQYLGKILSRWAELDGAKAAEMVMKIPVPTAWQRSSLIHAIAQAWAVQDTAAAQAWALTLMDPRIRNGVVREIAMVHGERDPIAALDVLKSIAAKAPDYHLYEPFFEKWARRDPAEAARQAQALPAGADKNAALKTVAERWAERDPKAALTWIQSLPNAAAKGGLMQGLFARWSTLDPTAAVEAMRQLPPGPEREAMLALGVAGLAVKDVARARQLAEELPEGAPRNNALLEAAKRLLISEPAAAAEIALHLPPAQNQKITLEAALQRWAKQDRDAATAFIEQSFPPGQKRQSAIASTLVEWSFSDPKNALEWLNQRGYHSWEEMGGAIHSWAGQDAEAALAWLDARPGLPSAGPLRNTVISAIASAQPEKAKDTFMQLPAQERQAGTAAWIATCWARQNPNSAAAWALSLPEEALRDSALRSVAATWSGADFAQSAAWVEKLPAGTHRDAAVGGFAETAVDKDPAAAGAWAETIVEPNLRLLSVQKVYVAWKYRDRPAADQWLLQTPGLSAEAKESLRR